jgi:hypothetical protein
MYKAREGLKDLITPGHIKTHTQLDQVGIEVPFRLHAFFFPIEILNVYMQAGRQQVRGS